jgi:hypothetical protein
MGFADFVVRRLEAEARIAEAAGWKTRAETAEAAHAEALARITELEEGLEPFAKAFAQMGRLVEMHHPWIDLSPRNYGGVLEKPLETEYFRRAAFLLQGGTGKGASNASPSPPDATRHGSNPTSESSGKES